ncbi:MAG: hypothetical protein H0X33_13370 [Taibaiella sp.]|nr:hypothetical protein [Taibaiella sp.]
MTPDEFFAECLTVGDLVKVLSELPQDAVVVKFAGGDCDGYVPAGKKEFKVTTMGLRSDWNSHVYHGPFDNKEDMRRGYGRAASYLKKFKAVEL